MSASKYRSWSICEQDSRTRNFCIRQITIASHLMFRLTEWLIVINILLDNFNVVRLPNFIRLSHMFEEFEDVIFEYSILYVGSIGEWRVWQSNLLEVVGGNHQCYFSQTWIQSPCLLSDRQMDIPRIQFRFLTLHKRSRSRHCCSEWVMPFHLARDVTHHISVHVYHVLMKQVNLRLSDTWGT